MENALFITFIEAALDLPYAVEGHDSMEAAEAAADRLQADADRAGYYVSYRALEASEFAAYAEEEAELF